MTKKFVKLSLHILTRKMIDAEAAQGRLSSDSPDAGDIPLPRWGAGIQKRAEIVDSPEQQKLLKDVSSHTRCPWHQLLNPKIWQNPKS